MALDARARLDAFTLFSTAASAGAHLFIALSMGAFWLSLDPVGFMETFFGQWLRFLATIMPLLLMSLYSLARSSRRDASDPERARLWRLAIWCLIADCLITLLFHLPLNLRLGAATYSPDEAAKSALYGFLSIFGSITPENASFTRAIWVVGHLPRIGLTVAVFYFAARAVLKRQTQNAAST